ncbi:hypothetical protein BJ944DRAFT_187225 [Cunninghamella echinulata]|nr:hypothetical protein BJ944DRAFT_187225 [Cunninghamella echinulata]
MNLLSSQARIYLICSYVSLGGFMNRYDTGVISAIMVIPFFTDKYQLESDNGAPGVAAVTVSLATAFLASFVSGFVADRLGRKRLFYIGTLLNLLGCAIQVGGSGLASFLSGRIITGMGVGIFGMLVPLYQSEIARPENRGRLITLYQVGVTLGISISYWISYAAYVNQDHVPTSLPIAFQIVPGGLLILGLHLIPESPRWLIYRKRCDEALEILALLRSEGDKNNLDLQMEFTGVRQDVWFDKHYTRKSFVGLWSAGTENNRKRTLLGMGIHIFTQLSGTNVILFYLPHIVRASGVVSVTMSVFLGNGIAGIINFCATLPCFYFIDRWDRRRILVFGALAMAISMLVVTIISAKFDNQDSTTSLHFYPGTSFPIMGGSDPVVSYIMLTLLYLFIAFFSLSWGAVGWIYPAEIYPQMIRANAMGVTTSVSYFFNLVMTLVTPLMFSGLTWGTYLFFGCICLLMAWTVHRWYPETRGRSLEEINLIFSGALIDQSPGAHHPQTAIATLKHLERIQYKEKREQLAKRTVQTDIELGQEPLSGPISTVVQSLESNMATTKSSTNDSHSNNNNNSNNQDNNNNSNGISSLSPFSARRPSLYNLRPLHIRRPSLAPNNGNKLKQQYEEEEDADDEYEEHPPPITPPTLPLTTTFTFSNNSNTGESFNEDSTSA